MSCSTLMKSLKEMTIMAILNLGQKTEKMLEDTNTPEEIKSKGFAANFYEAWLKENPESSLSKTKLCILYTKLDIAWR